jgi:gliding motility-associated-like protein
VRGIGGNDSLIYRLYTPTDTILPTDAYLEGDTTVGVFTGLESASYTVIATDSLSCDPDTLVISVPMEIRMDTVSQISCPGSGDGAVAVEVLQGNPAFTYIWSMADSINDSTRVVTQLDTTTSTAYSDTITGLSKGWYIIKVIDYYGIEAVDSVYLDEAPPIELSYNVNQAYCDSSLTPLGDDVGSIALDVQGGTPYADGEYEYSWQGDSPVKGLDSIANLTAGFYNITVYDSLGCTREEVVEVQSNSNYSIDVAVLPIFDTICLNNSVSLYPSTISKVDSLYWSPVEEDYYSINDLDTIVATPRRDTTYTLHVKNAHCYTAVSRLVDIYPILEIEIDENDDETDNQLSFLENVNEVDLTASAENDADLPDSIISYNWGPGTYFVSTTGLQSTLSIDIMRENEIAQQKIWLIAEVDHGSETCYETDSMMVHVVPNVNPTDAFSPNGDNINDVWKIKDADNYNNLEVIIFNRWGVEVFRRKPYSNDEGAAWDGRNSNGKELPSGTYYYIINSHEKGVDILSGTVTIIR